MADNDLPPGFQLEEPASAGDSGADAAVPPPPGFQLEEERYGTTGQQLAAGAEGALQGAIGPFALMAEKAIGIPVQDIRGRAEQHPWTHGLGEAAGLAGSSMLGTGEGALLGKVGEAVAPAGEALTRAATLGGSAGALTKGASTISRIASAGIKTGAEMAALQSSDEISKMITEDPGQSLGTAAINIGLSGVIGGAGGAVLGSVSPLWKASMEKIGVPKLIDDAKAQYGFRQSLPNGGDVPAAITDELTTRMGEMDTVREQMGNLKGASLARAMPEVTPENTAKIDAQIQEIASQMTNNIEKASENAYLKGAVPKLAQDFNDFLEVVTDPEATYAEKFDAIDDLKRAQQAKARYNATAEDTALGSFTKNTARDLRLALEDQKVWGDAAAVQAKVNAAIKDSIDATEDAVGKFSMRSAAEGRIVDPTKVNTLVNQSLKGKAGLKTNFINNYLESTQDLADTINKIHTDAGLEAPVRLTPTPALNHTLGRSSAGTTLGNWLFDKGLASAAGHAGAEAAGAGLGALVGHPAIGALIGERMLAPAFTSMAKPLMESASRSEAFKGSLDYVANVIRGDRLLSKGVMNLFRPGAEVLSKDLMPNVASREKLQKSLDSMDNIDSATNVGGNLHHYLPGHATAAAATAAAASNIFKNLKPTQMQQGPLDKPTPIDKNKQAQYDRALDIAEQPLMALHHAKNGTLRPQDVQILNTLYPQIRAKIANQCFQEITKARAEGHDIPYHQRQSLSLLMGQPLDSTLSQAGMAAIMMANAPKGPQAAPGGKTKAVSKSTASTQEKVNQMYATPGQARTAHQVSGG